MLLWFNSSSRKGATEVCVFTEGTPFSLFLDFDSLSCGSQPRLSLFLFFFSPVLLRYNSYTSYLHFKAFLSIGVPWKPLFPDLLTSRLPQTFSALSDGSFTALRKPPLATREPAPASPPCALHFSVKTMSLLFTDSTHMPHIYFLGTIHMFRKPLGHSPDHVSPIAAGKQEASSRAQQLTTHWGPNACLAPIWHRSPSAAPLPSRVGGKQDPLQAESFYLYPILIRLVSR